MMVLLRVLLTKVYGQADNEMMRVYVNLKFKMKLAYECFLRKASLSEHIRGAIKQTFEENQMVAKAELKELLYREDGAAPLYNTSYSEDTNQSRATPRSELLFVASLILGKLDEGLAKKDVAA